MKWEGRENTYLMMTVIHRRDNRIYIDQALRERKEEKKIAMAKKSIRVTRGQLEWAGFSRIVQ